MVSGLRCSDMMLRMKYAGINSEIEADVRKAVKRSVRGRMRGICMCL